MSTYNKRLNTFATQEVYTALANLPNFNVLVYIE